MHYYQQNISNESSKVLKLAEEKASRGLLYQKQEKLETAISLYQEALTLVPHLHYVQYNLGIAFQNQGNLSAAYVHYQQAIAHNPQHIQAYYNIGTVLQQQGLLERAISSYQKVINLSQGKAENILIQVQAYSNWGSILIKEGRASEAIEIFQQAINLKPDDASLYNNQGQAFLAFGKVEKAIINYRQALALNPQLIVARYNLGKVYQQKGLHSEAIVYFQEIIKESPENLSAHSDCAFSFLELGKLAAAIPHLQKVINNNSFVESYCEKADLLTGLDELEKAKIACAKFLEEVRRKKEEGRSQELMGTQTSSNYQYSEEVRRKKEEGRSKKEEVKSQKEEGRSQEWMGTQTSSNYQYSEEVRTKKEEGRSKKEEVKSQKEEGRSQEWMGTQTSSNYQYSVDGEILNLKEIDKLYLAEVRKNLILTYSSLGNVLFEYGEYSQAEHYYQKALKFQPLNVDLHLKLGNSLAKQKRFNTAIIVYHFGLAVEPDNSAISQALEKVLAKRNNFEEGRRKKEEGRRKKEEGERKKSMGTQILTNCQHPVDDRVLNLKEEEGRRKKSEVKSQKSKGISQKWMGTQISNNQVKCQGLNCQPCLKRIFKKLQPINLGNSIHSLSREKIQKINIDFPETPKFVTEVINGRAWIVPQKNNWMICNAIAIINQDNQLLAEVSREYPGELPGCDKYDINNHRFFTTEELPPLEQINGTVAVLSGLSGNVYFHWMVDILPRIEILRRNGINFEQIDWFLINSTKQPFQQETLRILGIPEDKIIESDRHPYIQAKKLIVPSFSGHLAWAERWVLEFHRQVFLNRSISTVFKDGFKQKENKNNQVISYPERIYISRNKAKYRRVINEEKLIDLLSQYGFITIELETLSVVEQVALFANAKVIVSPHGSGLTNIMFCRPDTTVVELVSPNYIKHYYWAIAQQLGLKCYYLVGEEFSYYPIRQIMYPNSLTEDIIINLSKLEKILSQASIIKVNSDPKVKFLREEETYQEKILLERKLSNSEVDVFTFSQNTGKEYNVNQTVASNQMTLKVNPTETATHFHEKALSYLDKNKLDEAKAACEQVLKNQPDFAPAYKTMGIIVQKEGQTEAAFEWYSRAIKIQPNFAEAYVNIGTLYARKQQWQEAIEYYQKAITIKPDLVPAYRNIAKAYQKVGKVVEAANFKYQAYCLDSTNIKEQEYINLGDTLLKHQKLTEAISCYLSATKLNPNSVVAYQNIAKALSQTGNFEPRLQGTNNSFPLKPEIDFKIKQTTETTAENLLFPIEVNLTNTEKNEQQTVSFKDASSELEKIEETLPEIDRPQIENSIVKIQTSKMKFQKLSFKNQNSKERSQKWIATKTPTNFQHLKSAVVLPDVYIQKAIAYNQKGLYEQAIAECQQAIAVQPNMAMAYKILGNAQQKIGSASQLQEAKQNYLKAISLDSQDASIHVNLGSLYAQEQLWAKAIPCYQQAIAIKPDFVGAYRNLAKAWTQVSRQVEAADCWYEAYTLDQVNITPDQHLSLGNTLCRQGQLTKAISCYQRAIKLNPNYVAAYQNLATTFKRQGKLDQAAIYAEKAQKISNISVKKQVETNGKKPQYINPEDVLQSYPNLNKKDKLPQINQADLIKQAEADFVNSKFYSAISTCEEAISIKPHAVAYQIMGKAWVEVNKPDSAIAAYQKAIEIKPDFGEIYASLGELYAQHQRQKEAIVAYKKAIKFAPDLKDSYRGLVEILLDQGKVDEAEELSYNALIQHPSWATAQEFCTLGRALIAENKTHKGIACFDQAIELDPKLLEAHYSLGKALAEKGEWLEAINCYQQVIQLEQNETEENYSESNINIGEVYHLLGDALQETGKLDESIEAYQQAIELTGN
ncbi:tetratricopeptide repeat protein [Okeania sp. SIO2B3]|uniref:tetratricopeptide repeat protein n=1 Tax=Okeania sp. SIO2B3 TaxID=2607784 RepID=UPI0025CECFBE|nr:tetratricopeptide repeat protein [Okeania sp. SIO2B3]